MTKDNIKRTAILHFNQYGYEGVKMAHIANDIGIRKQTLSYHYPSKKELAEELYTEVVDEEIMFMQQYFAERQQLTAKQQLYDFLIETKARFHAKPNVTFLQSMAFTAPVEVRDYISAQYLMYFHALKNEILSVFQQSNITYKAEDCTLGFVTLFDGLITQLVYATKQSFEQALEAAFTIFWRGIEAENGLG